MLPTIIIPLIFAFSPIQMISANSAYPDAVVSLWRLDSKGKEAEQFLYVAALIRPNCIFMYASFTGEIKPYNRVGFYTGSSSKLGRMENSAIVGDLRVPRHRNFRLLVVKPDVKLQTPYEITDYPYHCGEAVIEDWGHFIGWRDKDGPRKDEVSFYRNKQIKLITKPSADDSKDFPLGSFVVKNNKIVAITYHISKFQERSFIQPPNTTDERLQNLFEKASELQEAGADDPYPDAVVSFWHSKAGSKELLYVGALIESNWIFIPRDFYKTLKTFENIILFIGRKYDSETLSPVKTTIIGEKVIPGTDRFTILLIEPGIRLPTPFVVTNLDAYGKMEYSGDFIGWKRKNEVERKAATFCVFQGFHLNFEDEETALDNFPLGSFIVKGKDIIAVLHNITQEGELEFLQLYRQESVELNELFELENNSEIKRKLNSPELAEDKRQKVFIEH